jgi:fumarate reductase subunit D
VAEPTKTNLDPLLWMGFGAGGAIAAVALPIVVVLFGIAFPLGLLAPPSSTIR